MAAASTNAGEARVIGRDFVGRFLHAQTRPLILGWDFSGIVEELGEGVTGLNVGDEVWGHLQFTPGQKQGSYAEYLTVSPAEVALKPAGVSHQLAAASPTITMTALQSLRDCGRLSSGGRVLIIGAAGGIGAAAVGIAKQMGAHVTALCSTADVERVKAYGADTVIDRRKDNIFESDQTFDVIFDTPAVYSFGKCSRLLNKRGTYVTTMPAFTLLSGMLKSLFSSKRVRFVQVASKRADLELVSSWFAKGLSTTIDSTFKVAELAKALARQATPGRAGRVVVEVEGGWH